jgi:hypothetical protein
MLLSYGTRMDEQLGGGNKSLRTIPGALLLGSTGARLWADYVEPVPGFSGCFDFIHKVNIPLLFRVNANLTNSFEPCRSEWFPSHLLMEYADSRLALSDRKFITWDDCAVSCQVWTNRSSEVLTLRLETYADVFEQQDDGSLHGTFRIEHFSFDIQAVIAVSSPALLTEVRLQPGESTELIIAAALGIAGQDSTEKLRSRASAYTQPGLTGDRAVDRQRNEYQTWFDRTPAFHSSDTVLNKTWTYRWFLLRHNLADPQYGHLSYPLFYEGRSHKKSKRPFSKGGWEFSKLINLSQPLHVMDARWHHDPVYCEGAFNNMVASPGEDGMLRCLTVDTIMHSFANFGVWAAYQLYLVHRNEKTVAKWLPALKRNVAAWDEVHGNERDHLLIEHKHTRTGKEYQPSYWYFHQFPKNPRDKATYTHLKRVDRAVYHYLNLLGLSYLCEAVGDPDAQMWQEKASSLKQDILEKMWDEASQFFYDLHYETDEKAFVKNIVGFFPGWAELTDDRFNGMIEHLFDENGFHTRCPFPTVSADCPAFSPGGGWLGQLFEGRNGCVWNGPTWPYSNGITLDALARESKRRDHAFDKQFGHYLREYSFLHFMQRDLNQPGLVEQYNSVTGEPLSDEQEYNHSYYIDLVVTHVAGLSIQPNGIVLDPLDTGLDYFSLDRVKAAGVELRITYMKPGAVPAADAPPLEEGYRLYANGRLVFSNNTLCRTELTWEDLCK